MFGERSTAIDGLRAVDLGAGEGRDAAFFAKNGLDVLAVDVALNCLEKALRLAREEGVELQVERGNINSLGLRGPFHLVYSIGTIQYLSPENRLARFGHLRDRTVPGGLHALFAFVDHPDVPPVPDFMADEHLYAPKELPGFYAGWEILHARSFVFDDSSGGTPTATPPRSTFSEDPLARAPSRAAASLGGPGLFGAERV